MSLNLQTILLRSVLLFTLVFGAVFAVMESVSPSYRGATTLVLFSTSTLTAQQMETVTENVEVILESPEFQDGVLNAWYEETEEWKQFSLMVHNPAGSVLVLSYTDDATDPYAVREMLGHGAIPGGYGDIEKLRFIAGSLGAIFGRGKVTESRFSVTSLLTAFLVAILIAGSVEYGFFRYSQKRSERAFRSVIEEKISGKSEYEEKWWEKKPETDVLKTLEKNSLDRDVYIPFPDTKKQKEVFAPNPVSDKKSEEQPTRVFPATGSAPINLPIAENVSGVVLPYLPLPAKVSVAEDTELPPDDVMVSEAPVITNPEPSVAELKERLNKLLRGEMG